MDMANKKVAGDSSPIIIKKYANRRLYNTETSSYITLELLSQMTREGREFVVVDARNSTGVKPDVSNRAMSVSVGGPAGFQFALPPNVIP